MGRLAIGLLPLVLLGSVLAQTPRDISVKGRDSFEADFASGGALAIHLPSSEAQIKAGEEDKIHVRLENVSDRQLSEMEIRFQHDGSNGKLSVEGPAISANNKLRIVVEVPKVIDLRFRMPFGDITIERLIGNKDIEVHAGDITVNVGAAGDYVHAEASVNSGDLDASPFGVSKSGLFRSFDKDGGGKYRLHVHLGAGDLKLE